MSRAVVDDFFAATVKRHSLKHPGFLFSIARAIFKLVFCAQPSGCIQFPASAPGSVWLAARDGQRWRQLPGCDISALFNAGRVEIAGEQ
ncbi:hypothetical protein [Sandarakinorhabdus sp.]|uniref:hypothetical protein n=1 Tax=Sandarakinorhabdus sp. TaxID=1916663 RepID=UPI00333FC602